MAIHRAWAYVRSLLGIVGKDGTNIASEANPLPVQLTGLGVGNPGNDQHTDTQIPPSGMSISEDFSGSEWIDTKYKGNFIFLVAGTEDFDTVELEWSDDGSTPNGNVTTLTNDPVQGYNVYLSILNVFVSGRYVRTHIVNGTTAQTAPPFIGIASSGKESYQPLIGVKSDLNLILQAILTRSVLAGNLLDTDNVETLNFDNVLLSANKALTIADIPDELARDSSLTSGALPSGAIPSFDPVGPIVAANVIDTGWLPVSQWDYHFFHGIFDCAGVQIHLMDAEDDQGNGTITTSFANPTRITQGPGTSDDVGAPFFNKYFRVVIINNTGNNCNDWTYRSLGLNHAVGPILQALDSEIFDFYPAPITQSVSKGKNPDGLYTPVRTQGRHAANSSNTPLNGDTGGSDHIFRGEWFEWQANYVNLTVEVESDVEGMLYIDFAVVETPVNGDESSVKSSVTALYNPVGGIGFYRRQTPTQSQWVRTRYVNGPVAQSEFVLDAAFTVTAASTVQTPLSDNMSDEFLGGFTQASISAKDSGGNWEKIGRGGAGPGLDVHVTEIDDTVDIGGVSDLQTRSFIITADAQRIDEPLVAHPAGAIRVLKVVNGGNFHAYVKESDQVTTSSDPLFLGGWGYYQLTDGQELWAIGEDIGGSTNIVQLANTGNTAGGTATNPDDAKTSNNVRASRSAVGQTLTMEDFTFTLGGGFTAIDRLRIVHEARKDVAVATNTITHLQTEDGQVIDSTNVVTDTVLPAGNDKLVIVAVARNAANTVANVTGGGLTFTKVVPDVTVSDKRIDIWWAFGNPTSSLYTANMSSSTRANISASMYDGADADVTIDQAGTGVTGTGTVATASTLSHVAGGMGFMAVYHQATSATPGTGYTERGDETNGTGQNRVSLAVESRVFGSSGSEAATMNLNSSEIWAAAHITILPGTPAAVTETLSYEYNAVPGATSAQRTWTTTNDGLQFLDITSDFGTIVEADIPLIKIISTIDSIGEAALQSDEFSLEIRETSGASTRLIVSQARVGA